MFTIWYIAGILWSITTAKQSKANQRMAKLSHNNTNGINVKHIKISVWVWANCMIPEAEELRLLTHTAACWRQNVLTKFCQCSHQSWGTVRGSWAKIHFKHLNLKKEHKISKENTKHDMGQRFCCGAVWARLELFNPGPLRCALANC